MSNPKILFRKTVSSNDNNIVDEIVKSTGFFNPEEEKMAVELVDECLLNGEASGYYFIFAEIEGKVCAYSCFGPIDGTENSFDFYWIVTHNDYRGQGIGKALLSETEKAISDAGGCGIYVETASKPQYAPTRYFYEKNGYILEATLKGFYSPDDDKLIYVKRV